MRRFEACDFALLAAFIAMTVLGTWNRALLLNDGAYFLSVGWLGDAWDLYFSQFVGRAIPLLFSFGPAWAFRWAFTPSAATYMTLAHLLYFAAPLCFWLAIRAVEPQRAFSRLYLATMLALVYFPSEVVIGAGLWTVWAALLADPARSRTQAVSMTLAFALILAFTHPAMALMSLIYLAVGSALAVLGRPFPLRSLLAALFMALLLIAAYFATSRLFPSTNPSILEMQASASSDYVNPGWTLVTLVLFPMLAAMWLLVIMPGVPTVREHWRVPAPAILVIGVVGLWFAANGTSLYTYLFARHSTSHVLALALALAVPAAVWNARARDPLMWVAAIAITAAVSYNVDIALFGRFVDRHLTPGVTDVDRQAEPWPLPQGRGLVDTRIYFKWAAGANYTRDVVMGDYERYRQVLAFYSFFRSNRQSVLYHRLPAGHWVPFECAPMQRALALAHDPQDQMFLTFLGGHYCVP
jgi:hypothetical protein